MRLAGATRDGSRAPIWLATRRRPPGDPAGAFSTGRPQGPPIVDETSGVRRSWWISPLTGADRSPIVRLARRGRQRSPAPQGVACTARCRSGAARFCIAGSNPGGPPRSHQGGAKRASNRHARRVVWQRFLRAFPYGPWFGGLRPIDAGPTRPAHGGHDAAPGSPASVGSDGLSAAGVLSTGCPVDGVACRLGCPVGGGVLPLRVACRAGWPPSTLLSSSAAVPVAVSIGGWCQRRSASG
jgi:hypothetical protein